MFLKLNWLSILLIFALTLSILPNIAFATNLDNINTSKLSNNGSFYVDDLSKIPTKMISKEVKNWINDYTNLDPNNFHFELIKDEKNLNNKSNVIKFYDKRNQEIYYTLTPGTTTVESNYDTTKNTPLLGISTHFSIVNGLQVITSQVGVTFYRMLGDIPIKGDSSNRYDLPPGGVLNYNPSPEWSHATISINVKNDPFRIQPDIYHWLLPLGTWHTATIQQGKKYYLDFS